MRFFLCTFIFFVGLAFGTRQIPDVFYFKSPLGVDPHKTMFIRYSPLQSYLEGEFCKSPFRMESTGNYRGYQAFWSVDGGKLFLDSVIVAKSSFNGETGEYYYKERKVDLKWLFGPAAEPPIAAVWVNGIFYAEIDNALNKEKVALGLVEFNSGFMMPEIGTRKYVNGAYVEDASYEKLEKLKAKPSQEFVSPKCVDGWEKPLPELEKLYEEISPPELKAAIQEKRAKMEARFAAMEMAVKKDPAFQRFSEKFETVQVRNVLGLDVDYFLKVKNPETISHVKWNNHFDKKAKVNLKKTLGAYEAAEKALNRFGWLKSWREQSSSNGVQMDLCNESVCSLSPLALNFSIGKNAGALWKNLRLKGKPEFAIYLRENRKNVAILLGNKVHDQLLLVSLGKRRTDLLSLPADLEISSLYFKDQKDYILISTTGETQVHKTEASESNTKKYFGSMGITR